MATVNSRYNVGGVLLSRPFKIRRLGHFGFNVIKVTEGVEFYRDLLGFKLSDTIDFGKAPWAPKGDDLGDTRGYFMRYGTDHHAFVLFNRKVLDSRPDRKFAPEVTINQITWQCGSLREIMDAHTYFQERGTRIQRVGRDMPGSNWHVYVYDPDGHTNELYYGIEQIGWNQASKPTDMYYRGFGEKPSLPQISEIAEVAEALDKGIDILSGHQTREVLPETHDVDGVLLPRPFKITKIGPVGLFVDDVERAEAFYAERLGFVKSEESVYRGARSVFLRCGAEHHSLGLFPKELRRTLGLTEDTTCMSFGIELGSYAQLRESVAFLKSRGIRFVDSIPPELYPGIDYSAFALDPDGHCIQLYYYMEQVGWDGKVRPASERRAMTAAWPESLLPMSDTYVDQVFQGPLG
ncbi:MAG: extradiol dioxygenase [Candidatus Rokuibacteriota bacterium]|nr:MAG: extradiol dioxygenase [Candidatus Rokubacteria bacterium]